MFSLSLRRAADIGFLMTRTRKPIRLAAVIIGVAQNQAWRFAMFRFARLLPVFILPVFLPAGQLHAQSLSAQSPLLAQSKTPVEMASLRPGNGLVWQRSSPTL